jgi:hypothetical protein
MALDLHHLDADSAYHNWLEQNGVLHTPENERAFTAGFNILSRFIEGPEQEEVDWFVVAEAVRDTCDENGLGGPKDMQAIFAKRGLLVVHKGDAPATPSP